MHVKLSKASAHNWAQNRMTSVVYSKQTAKADSEQRAVPLGITNLCGLRGRDAHLGKLSLKFAAVSTELQALATQFR